MKLDPRGSDARRALSGLLAAGEWAGSGGADAAAEALRGVSEDAASDGVLRELAQLKLVMLEGSSMDPSQRDEILAHLSRSGGPFEALALEQKAVALIEAGRDNDAVTLIRQIQKKPELSEALRRRLSEMMIALGIEPEPANSVPAE
ncbi:hypothetical protein [Paracoccus methylarcula]|uniref:hypothetical protein n=1 Tax=Paracoccus methylarcula TaxID=72022 RepID=UPI001FE728B5|nr:hypothetical protein [Paracoccus methylarcula]